MILFLAEIDSSGKAVHLFLSGNNRLGSLGVAFFMEARHLMDANGALLDSRRGNRLAIIMTAERLENVVVYPNPYKIAGAQNPLMFGNLPAGSEVFIYSASGRLIRRLNESDGSGGVQWDLKTVSGDIAASGVYVYIARHAEQEVSGKFMIIR